ncbi:glycoside hydrolase family 76 protein [[Candida] arabinofermentans NRRL YB-2248]|uniref:Mannan endo-1,6-alpha-mannosidase n=1 Tax=[Candida] arabinofermentans NRRL YB-2248 TaxID=983967 RepID=A0A1E4T1I6_9ASCO|nr:glycoside hydrolase family 76 protein [[Candida] arabinofermentans NRRL YB-2248]
MLLNILILALAATTNALTLDTTSQDSICSAATLITNGIMDYYEGIRYGGVVGMFQAPYYWWEAGEVFGGMLDTWYFCQNDTYEKILYDALIAQKGDDNDYIPTNQSSTEGNDDQAFWGFAVLGAAERNFTNPTGDDDSESWISYAQAVYTTMWARWDTENCGGGLRWQIFSLNTGYDYKNTISNASLFHIAARLARYTQNDTYVTVAEEVHDWLRDVNFVTLNGDSYSVYDGANIGTNNCSTISTSEWTYSYGLLLAGSAYLYNYTEDETWLTEVGRYYNGISIFLNSSSDPIIYERQCEVSGTCNNDQRSFKSIFSRCLGLTAKLVPDYHDQIMTIITASAKGAAISCSGGSDGHTCGQNWGYGSWDGWYGLGEQISALEVMQNLLIDEFDAPYTMEKGGSSNIDYSSGQDATTSTNVNEITVIKKDKVGAGIVTAIVSFVLIGLGVWMIF